MRTLRVVALAGIGLTATLLAACAALYRPEIDYDDLEERYANAASRFVDLPGDLHVHYRDEGNPNGPVVVMIHGFAASLHAWEPWVARLGDRYRVVTLDLPAHGLTRGPASYRMSLAGSAEVVRQLVDYLGIGQFVIVGNSMGGGVAWNFALAHPDRLLGLVLVDPVGAANARRRPDGAPIVFRAMESPIGRALLKRANLRPLAAQGLRAAYLDQHLVTPALIDRYVDLSRAPGHRDIILASRPDPLPSIDRFRALATPTLILHGEADKLIPVASSRALAGAIPGARLILYPGVGHVPMEQIPDRSAADVRLFIEGLVGER